MKVTGSATVAAPRERVFEALRDPAVLARTIPGCRGLEPTGPDSYRLTVSAGVAAIRGTYTGQVALSDPEPPSSFVLRARGQGAPGTVDATVQVLLSTDGADRTRVDYDADATVGGMVGGVGQRLLAGAARKTATEFFAAVARDLTEPAASTAGPGGPEPRRAMPGVYPGETAPAARPGETGAGTAWGGEAGGGTARGGEAGAGTAWGGEAGGAGIAWGGAQTASFEAAPGSASGVPHAAPPPGSAVPGGPSALPPGSARSAEPGGGRAGEARAVAAGVVAGAVAGAAAALAGVAIGAAIARRSAR